ncbi:MAG: site-2 protease family protein [Candidatus Paceibacterota bacterium]|jgi:Zn-dependent protease
MDISVIFQILILIFSVIIHEISHGFIALCFGDKTALYEGRLTLNPVKHLDWLGSVILPLVLYITNAGFMIGWAKPVPYNPYNLKNRNIAEPLISLAGPVSNLLVATIFGLIIRGISYFGLISSAPMTNLINIFGFVVLINISLAVFNLLPIPPLDGSKIFFAFLPLKAKYVFQDLSEKYGLFLILAIVMFLPNFISPVIFSLFKLITGLN